jgi:hypothetical protein
MKVHKGRGHITLIEKDIAFTVFRGGRASKEQLLRGF